MQIVLLHPNKKVTCINNRLLKVIYNKEKIFQNESKKFKILWVLGMPFSFLNRSFFMCKTTVVYHTNNVCSPGSQ